jgi:hypothetical protein
MSVWAECMCCVRQLCKARSVAGRPRPCASKPTPQQIRLSKHTPPSHVSRALAKMQCKAVAGHLRGLPHRAQLCSAGPSSAVPPVRARRCQPAVASDGASSSASVCGLRGGLSAAAATQLDSAAQPGPAQQAPRHKTICIQGLQVPGVQRRQLLAAATALAGTSLAPHTAAAAAPPAASTAGRPPVCADHVDGTMIASLTRAIYAAVISLGVRAYATHTRPAPRCEGNGRPSAGKQPC